MRSRGLFYILGAVIGGAIGWLSNLQDTSVLIIATMSGLAAQKGADGVGWVAPPVSRSRLTTLFPQ